MLRSCAVLVLAALALAGCSRVDAQPSKPVAAAPSLPCSLPYGTQVTLLAPLPGSASVTTRNAPVLVAASRDLPKTTTVVAIGAKGSTTVAPLERTAKPARSGPAAFANPVYYRATGLALRAHRHYHIALDDLAQNGCAPFAAMTGNARFST